MNKIQKGRFAASITLKVANMKKEDSFTLYPYSGGDEIFLQSGKRWIEVNIRTGRGVIIAKGVNYPNRWKMLQVGKIDFVLPSEALASLQEHLWNNSGLQGVGTGLVFENKELFSL